MGPNWDARHHQWLDSAAFACNTAVVLEWCQILLSIGLVIHIVEHRAKLESYGVYWLRPIGLRFDRTLGAISGHSTIAEVSFGGVARSEAIAIDHASNYIQVTIP